MTNMGMTEKQYREELTEFSFHVVAKPLIFVIGLFIVSKATGSLFGNFDVVNQVFASIGGVGCLVQYYFYVKTKFMNDAKAWANTKGG